VLVGDGYVKSEDWKVKQLRYYITLRLSPLAINLAQNLPRMGDFRNWLTTTGEVDMLKTAVIELSRLRTIYAL